MASISICEIQSARFNLRRPLGSWAGRVRAHRHPSSVAIAAGRRTGSARRARSSGQRPTEPVARHPCWRRLLRVSRESLALFRPHERRSINPATSKSSFNLFRRVCAYICLFKRQRAQSTPRNLRQVGHQVHANQHADPRATASPLPARRASRRSEAPSSDPAGYRAPYFFLGGGAASTGAVGCTSGLIMYSTSPSKTPRSPSVFTSASGVPNALV